MPVISLAMKHQLMFIVLMATASAALAVIINNDHHQPSQQQQPQQLVHQRQKSSLPNRYTTKDTHPISYLDLLYGDLVNGDYETSRTSELLNAQELQPPSTDYRQFVNNGHQDDEQQDQESLSVNDKHLVSGGDEGERYSEKEMQEFIVKNSLKHSKLNLPDNDYTKDLYEELSFFGGLNTFANTKPLSCFNAKHLEHAGNDKYEFDVAVVGAGFNTGTSFRPGARFGPRSIRLASKRLGFGVLPVRGFLNKYYGGDESDLLPNLNVFDTLKVVDCGDVPMTPFDNRIALNQLYRGQRLIHRYSTPRQQNETGIPNDSTHWGNRPRIITLGGDHTVSLLTIKSAFETFGKPITVLHFDSHIDSWDPKVIGGDIRSNYFELNHGTFLHYAAEKGYIDKNSSMHIGIRAPLIDPDNDLVHDADCGFQIVYSREIDYIGIKGIVDRIKQRVYHATKGKVVDPEVPVFITFDIDVLDPVYAPATGTAEPGGFTIREVLNIVDGLEGINLVGADLVEVAPPYDNPSETTSLNAAQIVDSFLGLMAAFKYRQFS